MARIFISYARKDGAAVADELADRLRAFEHEVFLDVHSLRAGTRWRFELRRRIAWADVMVVLVTPVSNESDYVREEIALAEKLNRPILPIQIGDTPTPDHLRSEWQIVKLEGNNIDRVLLELEHALRQLPRKSPVPVLPLVGLALLVVVVAGGAFLLNQNRQPPATAPESTSSAGDVVYNEDFEDGVADEWALHWGQAYTVINDGTGNHVWRSAEGGEMFYQPSVDWSDYAVALDYYVVDWDEDADTGVVLAVRRQPDQECGRYDFVLHPDLLVVGAADDTCEGFIYFDQSDDHANTPGQWHTLYVEVDGDHIQWQIDDGAMDEFFDDRYTTGSFGILNLYDTEIWFDDLRIWLYG